jgi:hypothetical protein
MYWLLFLLFEPLVLFPQEAAAFDFYSAGATGGVSNVFTDKDFSIGKAFNAEFKAYGDWFYLGGSLGFSGYSFEDPLSSESYDYLPILFQAGFSNYLSKDGETIEGKRYHAGVGIGYAKGILSRQYQIGSGNPILNTKYYDDSFMLEFAAGLDLNLFDQLFIGPDLKYRITSFNFHDQAFSGGLFNSNYSGSGFTVSLNVSYFWGLF